MFGAFHQRFTTYCGVNKMKVIHMTYPQAVYNNGGKKDFTGKNCCFSRFLKEKHLFSVDNSVHSVHKSVKKTDYVVCFPQWTEFFFKPVLQICSLRFCIYMVKYNGMNFNS